MEQVRTKPLSDTGIFFRSIAGFAIAATGALYALQFLTKGGF